MKIKCSKCSKEFEMPDGFLGKIVCENCDPAMQGYKITEKECEHFWLPAQIIILDKYKQEHDSRGGSYRWRDVLRVERVYCAKCGKNCYADLSDLK